MSEPRKYDKWTADLHGTPDFRQIARDVFMGEDYGGNPIPEIEAALRQVWNARGLADVKAVESRMMSDSSMTAAIKELDR